MTDILVPFEQEGTKAIVRSWLKAVGDMVAVDDPIVELETDKVTQEVSAPVGGVLTEIILDTDAEAIPGAVLGRIEAVASLSVGVASAMPTGEADGRPGVTPPPGPSATPTRTAPAGALSPAVRRAIKQHGVDPSGIPGTGVGGRLTRADVDRVVAERASGGTAEPAATARTPEVPQPGGGVPAGTGGVRAIPHDRMRLAIAQNMSKSVTVAPHVTAVFECDFGAIDAHRRANKAQFEAQGAKLTYTAYIVAACVQAMRAAPAINSRWFDDRLELYDEVGVGVGTALGDSGLVVPVVQRAQSLSLLGIAQTLTDLTTRARSNKLLPADMRGGTFTVSNHGVSGSLLAAPIIINQPQSAILGVGKLEKRVVVREVQGADAILIRPMCYVSLTIDHRVVDGHQTNAWLSEFVAIIEGWGENA